ncbi:MAG: hypothetical protein FWB76_07790, partial [Oscillospiraceae bacterium]|nr:hypothetical protein [Oscillospiraceae bacterium]
PPPPSECLAVPIINAGSTGPIITALTETMEKNPNIAFNIKFDNGDIIEVTTQNRQTQIALAALETVATRK